MKATVREIVAFYEQHPECIGQIEVKTRFGLKTVEYADITAYDSEVVTVECGGAIISTSPDHLLHDGTKWIKVRDITVGSRLLLDDGIRQVTSLVLEPELEDLYDLQVEDVKEFYANGFVSHNSTILDALSFALFGRAFRNINKPTICNSTNGKDCLTEIEFETNGKSYKVVRGIKPTVFEIYSDGLLINQEASVKDYQEYLEKYILKMNFKSFSQIVVLGSASFTPFMQLTPADRRAVIEDLLDIQVFSIMNVLTKQRLQETKEFIEQNKIELKLKEEKKAFIETSLESLRQNNNDRLNDLRLQKENYLEQKLNTLHEMAVLMQERKDLQEAVTDQTELREKHRKLASMNDKIDTNRERLEKEIDFYTHSESCQTCKQDIAADFRESLVSERTKKMDEFISAQTKILADMEKCITAIQSNDTKINRINEISLDVTSKKNMVQHLQSIVNDTEDNIDRLKHSDDLIIANQAALDEVIADIENLEIKKKFHFGNKKMIDTALSLLKDGGIKSKIIKQYIPIINKTVNSYLSQMGFFVNFNLNESFSETIKSRFRDEFSYENFSEGEKLRIDLALMLCWRNISKMRNSVNTNLLIMDEILDSSLDNSGTDAFMKIILSMTDGTNVFIISHKQDQNIEKFQRIIKFEKKKNFSQISTVSN